jgi:hypothetical protein
VRGRGTYSADDALSCDTTTKPRGLARELSPKTGLRPGLHMRFCCDCCGEWITLASWD